MVCNIKQQILIHKIYITKTLQYVAQHLNELQKQTNRKNANNCNNILMHLWKRNWKLERRFRRVHILAIIMCSHALCLTCCVCVCVGLVLGGLYISPGLSVQSCIVRLRNRKTSLACSDAL